jgi:aerobic-type carbon monoxide dehydrogenase small subunit (CoxS/CutS family)
MAFAFKVNGRQVDVEAPKDTPLLWILREVYMQSVLRRARELVGLKPDIILTNATAANARPQLRRQQLGSVAVD